MSFVKYTGESRGAQDVQRSDGDFVTLGQGCQRQNDILPSNVDQESGSILRQVPCDLGNPGDRPRPIIDAESILSLMMNEIL